MFQQFIMCLPGVSEAREQVRATKENQFTAECVFGLQRSRAGWKALEFLAWWASDFSRRGHPARLSPVAAAPIEGDTIRFGETLEFVLQFGAVSAQSDANALMRGAAADFSTQLEKYRHIVT